MKKSRFSRKLRLESLEERALLAVMSGGEQVSVPLGTGSTGVLQDIVDVGSYKSESQSTGQDSVAVGGVDIFNLNSKPDSNYTIYLDFDGHVTSGTYWNEDYTNGRSIISPRFALDGNTSKSEFTAEEQTAIYEIWLRVSEDFMPFDINVTTVEPSAKAFQDGRAQRVVMGGTPDWVVAGGGFHYAVTYVGWFSKPGDLPAFVFTDTLLYQPSSSDPYLPDTSKPYTLDQRIKNIAEETSHELGHVFGIEGEKGQVTSQGTTPYYQGADGWAPIMGNGLYRYYNYPELTQWSKGEYPNPTSRDDELYIITTKNGFGYRNDDHGNSFNEATRIVITNGFGQTAGIIERNTDVDYFVFESSGSALNFHVGGIKGVTNLDTLVKVYDSGRRLIETHDPSDRLDVEFVFCGEAGTYYLTVEGTGRNTGTSGVYSDYGSLGAYTIDIEGPTTPSISVTDWVGDYDGKAHSVSLDGLQSGDVVYYSEDGVSYSTDELSYTAPGVYTVYVKVERSGCQDFTGTGTVTINAVTEKIQVAVVVGSSTASAMELDILPDSITTAAVGDTLYAQVWVLNADDSAAGCTGGYIDLRYTAAALDAGSYTVSNIYDQTATYVDASTDGLVARLGGYSQAGINDLAVDQWALLGTFTFMATAEGDVEIVTGLPTRNGSHIKGLNLSRAGEGSLADNEISFGRVSLTVTTGGQQLTAPVITTGTRGVYVSYGANRHQIRWTEVTNASGYELQYSADGNAWTSIKTSETGAVVTKLAYGSDVAYRVRALGTGSSTDSDWSAIKTFNVCPMDVNGDGDISNGDRALLVSAWLSEEGGDKYQHYADIDGDGDVSGGDRSFLNCNWLGSADDDDLIYPRALASATVFAEYASADPDIDVDLDVF